MTNPAKAQPEKPQVFITPADLDSIDALLGRSHNKPAAIHLLEEELDRAVLVDNPQDHDAFCRIGSWVEYEDLASGHVREIQLVLPPLADIDSAKISVLTLVGAALLGLTAQAEIGWTDDGDRAHRLKVLKVRNQARTAP